MLQREFIEGISTDEHLCMIDAATGNKYFYILDTRNSVDKIVDESGTVVESYEYTAYGDASLFDNSGDPISESVVGSPYRFQGRRYDEESGMMYFRNRQYSPEMKRFISMDPLGFVDSMNLYETFGCDPVNNTDRWGLDYIEVENGIVYWVAELKYEMPSWWPSFLGGPIEGDYEGIREAIGEVEGKNTIKLYGKFGEGRIDLNEIQSKISGIFGCNKNLYTGGLGLPGGIPKKEYMSLFAELRKSYSEKQNALRSYNNIKIDAERISGITKGVLDDYGRYIGRGKSFAKKLNYYFKTKFDISSKKTVGEASTVMEDFLKQVDDFEDVMQVINVSYDISQELKNTLSSKDMEFYADNCLNEGRMDILKLKFTVTLAKKIIGFFPDKANLLVGIVKELEAIEVALESISENLNTVARYMADTSEEIEAFKDFRRATERWDNLKIKWLREINSK